MNNEGLTIRVFFWILIIMGVAISISFPLISSKDNLSYKKDNITTHVDKNIYSNNGKLLIPKGGKISGVFHPETSAKLAYIEWKSYEVKLGELKK